VETPVLNYMMMHINKHRFPDSCYKENIHEMQFRRTFVAIHPDYYDTIYVHIYK
jgi:hypothetical protein